jgi:membrane protease YdiL (CAAX protease family)
VSAGLDAEGRMRLGWRVVLGVLVAIAANMLAGMTAAALTRGHPRLLDAIYRPLTMVLLLIGFSVLLLNADKAPEPPLRAMGLGPRRAWREAWLGLALGGGMVGAGVLAVALLGDLSFRAQLNSHTATLALLELFILATGAMMEELMFRGYPFQRLVEGLGAAQAIVVMSVLFGVVHLWNPHASVWGFSNTLAIGVLLSLGYLRTRALWLPWGVHLGWNLTLGMIFGLPVSGITQFAVVVKGTAKGPLWLTGGAYGLEASALGTVLVLLGIVILMKLTPGGGAGMQSARDGSKE